MFSMLFEILRKCKFYFSVEEIVEKGADVANSKVRGNVCGNKVKTYEYSYMLARGWHIFVTVSNKE